MWKLIPWEEVATLGTELQGMTIEGCDRGRVINSVVDTFEVADGLLFIGLQPALPFNQVLGGRIKGGGGCLTGDGRFSLSTHEGTYMIRVA